MILLISPNVDPITSRLFPFSCLLVRFRLFLYPKQSDYEQVVISAPSEPPYLLDGMGCHARRRHGAHSGTPLSHCPQPQQESGLLRCEAGQREAGHRRGYKVVEKGDDSCQVTLSAYPERRITIKKEGERYAGFLTINGVQARLTTLFVQLKPNSSINVDYVELQGYAVESGEPVTERIRK